MKTRLTVKLKLNTTSENNQSLLDTARAYHDALNDTSRVALENGKMSHHVKLQRRVCPALRERFALPAQLACSESRLVRATFQGLWTKVKQHASHRTRGDTKKRYQGLDKAPIFTSHTTPFTCQRNYRFHSDQRVAMTALEGPWIREGYHQPLNLIHKGSLGGVPLGGVPLGDAKLWRDPRTKPFYLWVSLEVNPSDPTPQTLRGIKGADCSSPRIPSESRRGERRQASDRQGGIA